MQDNGFKKYVVASCEVSTTFAISDSGAVIDNCTYCQWRAHNGGYCYLYRRSMADDAKHRPFFCGLEFKEVTP